MEHFADLVLEDLGIEELLGVLPFVERLALIQSLVALETNQLPSKRGRGDLCKVGFADPGGTLDQDGFSELFGQINNGRDSTARDVVIRFELGDYVVDGRKHSASSPDAVAGHIPL